MRLPLRRAGGVLLCVALAVAACSGSDDAADLEQDPDATSTSAPSTTSSTLPLPMPPPLDWSGCGGGFQCSTLTVPVDYDAPTGEQLQVALIKRPASDPAGRIGTLIMNPGGPGASGVRRVRRGFTITPEVAARFDIVGFDPRGVGESTPITCGGAAVDAFRAVDHAPTTPEGQQALEAAAQAVGEECARTEGARLPHLGTYEVARDVEMLRLALGEAKVSFVGISYGTAIGLLWADAYPTSVRALVLDGVDDPSETSTATDEAQLDAVDASFDAIAAACADDAGCPLIDHGGLAAAYDELERRLAAAGGTLDGVGLTQLRYAAFMATYGSEHWPRLWSAVDDGLDGDLEGIADMATSFRNLVAYAPFAVITCLDAPHPEGPAGWRTDAARAARSSPRFGAALANELLPCAYLPNGDHEPRAVQADGAPAILVVGSTGDVATPYAQAVAVADRLESGVLLTVEIDGHVAIGASDCAEQAITRYLVDGLLPDPEVRCEGG